MGQVLQVECQKGVGTTVALLEPVQAIGTLTRTDVTLGTATCSGLVGDASQCCPAVVLR